MKRLVGGILALGFSLQALAHGALADLHVYDRTEAKRLPVHWHQGRAYVVGKPGNEYQVVVRNNSSDEILTVVSVDGVNVITGETADPSQSGYVLSPRGGLEILGWRKDLSRTAAFYFTALADSYAARTGRPDNVGVIGVAVFRKKQHEIGSADAARGRAAESAKPQMGTGHGRQEHSPARFVSFERASYAPAQVLALYYDSHANLVARGIIRERVPVAPLPRPFPGFVPDPRG
jgi:hypothetical protein